jgi:outer membrane protein
MNRFLLAVLISVVAIPQFAFAAEEVKTAPAEHPEIVEKSEPPKEVKMGSVDLAMVAEKSDVGADAMATLKRMYEKFQATAKKKELELEKLKNALQSRDLAPDKRAAKEKQFQKKFGEYQKYGKNAQQELAKKQAELGKKIKDEIDKIVKDYGREHGYSVILNKEGLIYDDGKYKIRDLTEEILKLANSADKK